MYVFFNETATTETYTDCNTLSLHDALPICRAAVVDHPAQVGIGVDQRVGEQREVAGEAAEVRRAVELGLQDGVADLDERVGDLEVVVRGLDEGVREIGRAHV